MNVWVYLAQDGHAQKGQMSIIMVSFYSTVEPVWKVSEDP